MLKTKTFSLSIFTWRHLLMASTGTKELKASTAGPSTFAFLRTAWVNGNGDHIFSWATAWVFSVGGWEPRPGSTTPCQIWHCLPNSDRDQMGSQRLFLPSAVWTADSSSQTELGRRSLDVQKGTQMVPNWETSDDRCFILFKLDISGGVKSS